jgi:hypothetical protein
MNNSNSPEQAFQRQYAQALKNKAPILLLFVFGPLALFNLFVTSVLVVALVSHLTSPTGWILATFTGVAFLYCLQEIVFTVIVQVLARNTKFLQSQFHNPHKRLLKDFQVSNDS